ncbi:hypothetical protein [Bradyrhizobium genosp. SA-3]|uniref:hypothetical protein n=1 Tax=Bradyrhizobium genosp. SA-3 TaxID=508868 RepID=UPI0013EED4C5|nr:hypothetical protein [Bradyrhizobium genosp. SA-3]
MLEPGDYSPLICIKASGHSVWGVDADAPEYFAPELANAGVTLFEGSTHRISMRRQVRPFQEQNLCL